MHTDQQMFKFINLARAYPTYYVNLIDKQIQAFTNENDLTISNDIIYQTQQGKKLWQETRNFLINQQPLPGFKYHRGLAKAAEDHVIDLCQNKLFGHKGSDGSLFSERILRYCKKSPGAMAQIIGADFQQNPANHAQMTVLSLIIDDGVHDRGHRKTIFNSQYKYIGMKSGLQSDKIITVFNLTQNSYQIIENKICQSNKKNHQCILSKGVKQLNPSNHINENCDDNQKSKQKIKQSIKNKMQSKQIKKNPLKNISNKNFPNTFSHPTEFKEDNIQEKRERSPSFNKKNYASYLEDYHNPFQDHKENTNKAKEGSISAPNSNNSKNSFYKNSKKLAEKIQNIRTIYENGNRVVEKTTKWIYVNGSFDEDLQKHTYYL